MSQTHEALAGPRAPSFVVCPNGTNRSIQPRQSQPVRAPSPFLVARWLAVAVVAAVAAAVVAAVAVEVAAAAMAVGAEPQPRHGEIDGRRQRCPAASAESAAAAMVAAGWPRTLGGPSTGAPHALQNGCGSHHQQTWGACHSGCSGVPRREGPAAGGVASALPVDGVRNGLGQQSPDCGRRPMERWLFPTRPTRRHRAPHEPAVRWRRVHVPLGSARRAA